MANYDSSQASEVKSSIDNLKEPLEGYITMYNEAFDALPSLHPETQKQSIDENKIDLSFAIDDYGILTTHFANSIEDMAETDMIKSRDPANEFKPVEGTAEGENQDEESATADDVVEDEEGAVEGTEQEEQSAEADDIVEDIEGEAEGIAQAEQSANEETDTKASNSKLLESVKEKYKDPDELLESIKQNNIQKALERDDAFDQQVFDEQSKVQQDAINAGKRYYANPDSTNIEGANSKTSMADMHADSTVIENGSNVFMGSDFDELNANINAGIKFKSTITCLDGTVAKASKGDCVEVLGKKDGKVLVKDHYLGKIGYVDESDVYVVKGGVYRIGDSSNNVEPKPAIPGSQVSAKSTAEPGTKASQTEVPTSKPVETSNKVVVDTPKGGNLNFRTEAGTDSKVLGSIKNGTELEVIDDKSDPNWIKVKVMGEEVYVAKKYTAEVETSSTSSTGTESTPTAPAVETTGKTVTVSTKGGNLNMRQNVKGKGNVIGSVANGTELEVVGEDGKWLKVKDPSTGEVVKIAKKFTTENNNTSESTTPAENPTSEVEDSDGTAGNNSTSTPTTPKADTTPAAEPESDNPIKPIVVNENTPDIKVDGYSPVEGDTIEKLGEPDADGYVKVSIHTADGKTHTGTISEDAYDGFVEGYDFKFDKF